MTQPSPSSGSLPNSLPVAPRSLLDIAGQPKFGKYAGAMPSFDWRELAAPLRRGPLWRYFHHKRWQYVALATEELFCGIAIVDLGWISAAFAYAFDRRATKEIASFSQNGLPGMGAQIAMYPAVAASSSFQFFGKQIRYQHIEAQNSYELQLHCGDFEIDARWSAESAAPFLTAIGPIQGGAAHATLKSSGMPLHGEVKVAGRKYSLDGGVASFDYSNGYLARETQWRWASAHSLELGFNLQAGYFGNQENALWLDGALIALGAARFEYDAHDPMQAWHVYTDDGLLDLQFEPEGMRREDKNLAVAVSRYVQPIGRFNGWVKYSADAAPRLVRNLVGVTEDHFSKW